MMDLAGCLCSKLLTDSQQHALLGLRRHVQVSVRSTRAGLGVGSNIALRAKPCQLTQLHAGPFGILCAQWPWV